MVRNIRKIEPSVVKVPTKKRVAAYARVSSGKEAMLNSLSAQVSYYSQLIQKHRGWEYVGVYTDEAITGTKDNRAEFQRLLADCRNGKIDIIITKSISRLARNTVTMLETVRELKGLNVDVYFEKENIHSISGDGEVMLTILASFAQEESLSVSENCKWRIRNKFKEGHAHSFTIFGYELKDGTLEIVPEEAEVVQKIFNEYLSGKGKNAIIKNLNTYGYKTKNGCDWRENAVNRILRNEKYVGDMLLQKVFSSNHIEKQKRTNSGQLPMYYVKDSHEAIIDRDIFEQVQIELASRAKSYSIGTSNVKSYAFTSKILCSECGKNYRRKINNAGTKYAKTVWICSTFNRLGKESCHSKQIPDGVLEMLTAEFKKEIKQIVAYSDNRLKFIFADSTETERKWKY